MKNIKFEVYLVKQNDNILGGFLKLKQAEKFMRSKKDEFLDSGHGGFSRKDLKNSIGNYFYIQMIYVFD